MCDSWLWETPVNWNAQNENHRTCNVFIFFFFTLALSLLLFFSFAFIFLLFLFISFHFCVFVSHSSSSFPFCLFIAFFLCSLCCVSVSLAIAISKSHRFPFTRSLSRSHWLCRSFVVRYFITDSTQLLNVEWSFSDVGVCVCVCRVAFACVWVNTLTSGFFVVRSFVRFDLLPGVVTIDFVVIVGRSSFNTFSSFFRFTFYNCSICTA